MRLLGDPWRAIAILWLVAAVLFLGACGGDDLPAVPQPCSNVWQSVDCRSVDAEGLPINRCTDRSGRALPSCVVIHDTAGVAIALCLPSCPAVSS